MKVKELMSFLDNYYPVEKQMSFDNSGLQVGDFNAEVEKVYVCLDVELFHLEKAIKEGCNVILTHHPLIFKGIKSLVKDSFMYNVIKIAMNNNISILSCHTPFDSAEFGMNNSIFKKLASSEIKPFMEEEGNNYGIYFDIVDKNLGDIIDFMFEHFSNLERTRTYGDVNDKIVRIAFMGGSGGDYVDKAVSLGCDLYITSDLSYHDVQLAFRHNMKVIDLMHSVSEIQFVDVMSFILQKNNIEVIKNYRTFDSL